MWYDDGSATDALPTTITTTTNSNNSTNTQDQSPVRPPRRRCKPVSGAGASGPAKRSHSLTTGMTPVLAEIKSILKKPASMTTDDLSPVRSRAPVTVPSAPTCNGTQKKTKKQVQFDIVSIGTDKKSNDVPPEPVPVPEIRIEVPLSTSPVSTTTSLHQQQQDHRKDSTGKFISIEIVSDMISGKNYAPLTRSFYCV